MTKGKFLWGAALALALAAGTASAQTDILTKGSISGTVADSTGAVVPGATITVAGGTGERTTITNASGLFEVANLLPGSYAVKAALTGFKTDTVPNVVVYVGKSTALKFTLTTGEITEVVEVTAGAAAVDLSSTAIGANLDDQLYKNLPLARGVTSLFYLAPGTTDSLGGGRANPSISGGSPLDNLYIADGVNITDSAFGGLGIFSRSYGTLGVGINTTYIKEVQVKTGGFEPQYGQSQGGIVNIITKSGGSEWHGSLFGFGQPKSFEATRKQADDFNTNKVGKILKQEFFDAGLDVGGPLVKDKLFFYGSFNPSVRRDRAIGAARNANDIAAGKGRDSGLFALGEEKQRYRTLNYAVKLDYNLAPNHQLNFSIFGDPSKTNKASFATLNIDNTTADSVLDYGTRNTALRYSGSLTSSWILNASFSQGKNRFDEAGFDDFNQIVDRTQAATRGQFVPIGRGFVEPTDGTTYRGTLDTTKEFALAGNHSFGIGGQYQRGLYSGTRDRSGPHYTIPASNADGSQTFGPGVAGETLNAAWSLRTASSSCTLCPLMDIPGVGLKRVFLRQDRGEFGDPSFDTKSNYYAAYAQDTWRINKYVTALLGVRWEREILIGSPGPSGAVVDTSKPDPTSPFGTVPPFHNQWSPRIGLTIDPTGDGKTKLYGNFGHFQEFIPLDLAERSLSAEKDFTGGRFAPEFTIGADGQRHVVINPQGTVNPVVDAAHLISAAAGGPGGAVGISAQDPVSPILPGTKLGYAQEWLVGFERQLPSDFVFSVRYIDRKLKRIVEDASATSPEQFNAGLFGVTYFIANIDSKLDAAVNPIPHKYTPGGPLPAQCDPSLDTGEVLDHNGNSLGAVCFEALGVNGKPAGESGSDGVADGFPDPIHNYKAVEVELNKRFTHGWQLLLNYRWAKLDGNFEGHFRNDNGQTDPAISSLFDFVGGEFGLLGDQFNAGPLNTDRRHIANLYGSYALSSGLKGLNLGLGIRMESGIPINDFLAHPSYLNAGEIPVNGRGSLGRTPFYYRLDVHVDYPIQINDKVKLALVGDFFNITNNQKVRRVTEFEEISAGTLNVDFNKADPLSHPRANNLSAFQPPFNMRFGLRLDF